jgi:hypothetical protein
MSVDLDIDGVSKVGVTNTVNEEQRRVLVSRDPEQLALGALQATVALPGLTPAQTTKPHRVFRSPKFGPVEMVAWTNVNPNRSGLVNGRTAVQIASPVGMPPQLLVTEQITFGGNQYRWLDLYAQGQGGMLGYANSPQWTPTQNKLQETAQALLSFIPGAIVIYDFNMATNRLDLKVQALQGTSQSGLSLTETIPADASAQAACSEEPVVLLASSHDINAFYIDPILGHKTVTNIWMHQTPKGMAVIAARDAQGTAPSNRSTDYFAVAWEPDRGTLFTLVSNAGVPTGLMPGPDVTSAGVPGVTAAALADLDSDGLQDLIIAQADGTLMWSPQQPDRSFPPASSLCISAPGASSISIGDINGDQLPDLAVATSSHQLLIFRNQP